MTTRDGLSGLFPDEETYEYDEATLGYADFSGGEATRLLNVLPPESVAVIHKFAHDGPYDAVQAIGSIIGLVNGLDKRDPERKSSHAVELANEEIDRIQGFLGVIRGNSSIPVLGRVVEPGTSEDAAPIVWAVYDVTDQHPIIDDHMEVVDIARTHLAHEQDHRGDFDTASNRFISRMMFTAGVVIS